MHRMFAAERTAEALGAIGDELEPFALTDCADRRIIRGLTEEIDDREIAAVFACGYAPQETADHLIHAALRAGGSDNITVLVLKRC